MEAIFTYLLKMLICSALLFGYYRLALYNERFHRWNRFYLLAALLLSVIVPLVHLPWLKEEIPVISVVNTISWTTMATAAPRTSSFSWQQWTILAAALVSAILFLKLVAGMLQLAGIYRKAQVSPMDGEVQLVFTSLQQAPFSFFNWLFWRQDIDPVSATGQRMLAHEFAHIRQGHSFDKLLNELLLCVFWINPFFWLIRRELAVIHEFLADEKAVAANDGAALSEMILHAMHCQPVRPFVNPFFTSQLKRRLLMITMSKKPQYSYQRRIAGLVLMITSALVLTISVQNATAQSKTGSKPAQAQNKNAKTGSVNISKQNVNSKLPSTNDWLNAAEEPLVKRNGASPMYLLEEKEVSAAVIHALKPEAIREISVFKEKEAVEKYGEKGKNGVVVITLKADNTVSAALKPTVGELLQVSDDPLYIIDGKKANTKEFQYLNPNDIESVNVLKDKAATDKYGQEGKNGVIEVTLKPEPEKVFTVAEKMPQFPGGVTAWRHYLEVALNYPPAAQEAGVMGKASVSFIVDEEGNLRNLKIVENPGKGLGEEAMRLLRYSPKWEPAEQNGRKVAARVTQDLTFRLE